MDKTEHIFPFLWIKGESKQLIGEEIDAIYDCGLKAFCVESRVHPDFCGERWFDDFGFILEKAKEKGMQVWLLDDKKYPTGIANESIKNKYPELKSWHIYTRFIDVTGKVSNINVPLNIQKQIHEELLGCYILKRTNNGAIYDSARDITDNIHNNVLYIDIASGSYRIYFLYKSQGFAEADHPYNIDMMNAASVKKLVEEVYEPHYARFGKYFGKTFVGFFSDEPRLGNGVNTKVLFNRPAVTSTLGVEGLTYPYSENFEKKLGIKDRKKWLMLWLSSDSSPEFRCQYMSTVTETYSRNFNQTLADWCHKHGVKYSGHILEDSGAHLRTMCSAGHYFKAMEGADMAGIDVVSHQISLYETEYKHFAPISGGYANPKMFMYSLAKLASSAANIDPLKNGRALCELFGAYGFIESTTEMLYIVNHLLSRGINYFIPHAFSIGFGNTDCPPHFYADGKNPAYKGYAVLFAYMDKMAKLFSGGRSFADVAVLYHDESEWSGKEYVPCDNVAKILTENQIDFDIIYSELLKDIVVKENGISLGNRFYKYIVVPASEFITAKTVLRLNEISDRIIFTDFAPKNFNGKTIKLSAIANFLFDGLVTRKVIGYCKGLRIYDYEKNGKEYGFLFNESGNKIKFTLNSDKDLYGQDTVTGETYFFRAGEKICLKQGQAVLIGDFKKDYVKKAVGRVLIKNASVYLRKYDENEFKFYKNTDFSLIVNGKGEYPDFCGYIRYDFDIDFTGISSLEINYSGEFLECNIGELSEINIGGKMHVDTTRLIGKRRVSLVTATTLGYKINDGYSAYGYRTSTYVSSVRCIRG